MADLADQSRLLFEVKAALIDIEERLRKARLGRRRAGRRGGAGGGSRRGQAAAAVAPQPVPPPPPPPPAWCGLGGGLGGFGGGLGHGASPLLQLPGIGALRASAARA